MCFNKNSRYRAKTETFIVLKSSKIDDFYLDLPQDSQVNHVRAGLVVICGFGRATSEARCARSGPFIIFLGPPAGLGNPSFLSVNARVLTTNDHIYEKRFLESVFHFGGT